MSSEIPPVSPSQTSKCLLLGAHAGSDKPLAKLGSGKPLLSEVFAQNRTPQLEGHRGAQVASWERFPPTGNWDTSQHTTSDCSKATRAHARQVG